MDYSTKQLALLHYVLGDEYYSDFLAFSKEIDKVMNEHDVTEDEAIEIVMSYWRIPNVEEEND